MINKKRSIFCIIITSLLIIFVSITLLLTYNDIPLVKRSDAIYISSSDKEEIIETLKKGGIKLHWADYLLFELIDLPKEGWYKIEEDRRGRLYFFQDLHRQRADTMGIVIFAGDTVEEIFDRLSKDVSLNKEELAKFYEKYSRFLEGEILANKYTIAKHADEEVIVRYLIDQCSAELDFFAKERFGSDYTKLQLHEALIMASIIHKESNNLEEMSTIASVINNRLKKGMRLQMDGTLCYGKYSRTIVTSQRIKNDTSRFNTYKYKGLPPYPICTVTMDALEAATFPKESDYLYFMLDRDGTHNFASNYDDHRQNIRNFKDNISIKRDKKRAKKKKIEDAKRKIEDAKKKIEDAKKKKEEKKKAKIDIAKKKSLKIKKDDSNSTKKVEKSKINEDNITKKIEPKKDLQDKNSTKNIIDKKIVIKLEEDNKTNFIINIDKNDSYLSVF